MKTKIWLALLALYFVWGSTYLAIHFAVETIPPFLSAAIRFLISGAILVFWRFVAGDSLPTKPQWRSTAIVGVLLLLGGNGLLSVAEQRISSGVAALIVGTVPLWLVLLEAVLPGGTKPSSLAILGLLIGFGGIFLLIGPSEFISTTPNFDMTGIGIVILASFLWALGSIYSKNADLPPSTLMAVGIEMLIGSLAIFVVSGITGEWQGFHFSDVAPKSWMGLVYLITMGSLVGFVSYGWLLQNAPISMVATYAFVNPLVAVLLGAWLADEIITARILVAGLVIISSVVLINGSRPKKVKTEVTPVAEIVK